MFLSMSRPVSFALSFFKSLSLCLKPFYSSHPPPPLPNLRDIPLRKKEKEESERERESSRWGGGEEKPLPSLKKRERERGVEKGEE